MLYQKQKYQNFYQFCQNILYFKFIKNHLSFKGQIDFKSLVKSVSFLTSPVFFNPFLNGQILFVPDSLKLVRI